MVVNNPLEIDTELVKMIDQWRLEPTKYYTNIENWIESGERLQKAKQIVIRHN